MTKEYFIIHYIYTPKSVLFFQLVKKISYEDYESVLYEGMGGVLLLGVSSPTHFVREPVRSY